jgi:hypothetical protein
MSAQPQFVERAPAQTFSPEELARRTVHRRAVEAVIWGMPIVNFDLMLQAATHIGGAPNQIIYWSRLPDWKNQTLTPNPDAIYLMPFINTRNVGPVVLEIPPEGDGTIVGSAMDCWQTAIEDIGAAGVDKGKGGKYLFLPPGYKDNVPEGYIPMPSDTYQSYALLRSILKSGSDADVAKAVSYGKRIRLYPHLQAANQPETKFVDAIDAVFDSTIPYDLSFFQCLDRMVQFEPWLTRDKRMIDQLKSIGIEKGKPFQPRHETREILRQGAAEAHAWIDSQYESVFKPPFYDDAQWALPASQELLKGLMTNYAAADSYPVDARGLLYSYIFFSAKHLGAGQFYLMSIKDKNGEAFTGARVYRVNVPANAPVTQYWSATVYNRATHAFIRNMQRVSRSSQSPDLQKNADGSVDIYFAAKAPAGKESNSIPTDRGGQFEVLFRFYGPQKTLFDKTWKLPDIEKVQ